MRQAARRLRTQFRPLGQAVRLGLDKLYPLPPNTHWLPALFGLLAVVLVVQLATTFFDAVTSLVQSAAAAFGIAWEWSALLFPIVLLLLWTWARRVAGRVAPVVRVEEPPDPVRCLVLLVSPLRPADLDTARRAGGAIADVASRPAADHGLAPMIPWGQGIAAIAHHLGARAVPAGAPARPGRLERVVLIGSAGERGSATQLAELEALIGRLEDAAGHRLDDPARPGGALRVETLDQALAEAAAGFECGLDPERVDRFVAAFEALYPRLADAHGGEREVLLDVTGQTKTATAAAVAWAVLRPGRRFQYVTTEDRRVIAYDVTMDVSDLTMPRAGR